MDGMTTNGDGELDTEVLLALIKRRLRKAGDTDDLQGRLAMLELAATHFDLLDKLLGAGAPLPEDWGHR
jgi:hypothetical protein